jgi:predicted GIY-YIG superfamily endonuclease
VALAHAELHDDQESASRRERQIKGWTTAKKEALIAGDAASLKRLSVSQASPRFKKGRRALG